MSSNGRVHDFSKFYREYARGGIHAASAAAMTAFGLLTIYHDVFALLAVVSYVVPALYAYAERGSGVDSEPNRGRDADASRSEPASTMDPSESDAGSAGEAERDDRGSGERRERAGSRPPPSATAGRSDGVVDDGDVSEVGENEDEWEKSDGSHSDGADENKGEWTSVDSPVTVDFSDAVAAGDGVYAVGEDGVVLARQGDEWSAVLENGPGAQGENLTGIEATDDGRAVWVAGDGGALGRLDAESNRHTDYSAPDGDTSTVTDLAVVGRAGEEIVVLVNGSGEVRRGEYDGERVRWGDAQKPGSGSSFAAVSFADGECGYLVDTNGSVFRTTDGGERFDKVGIDDAGALTAVAPIPDDPGDAEAFVTEDDGTVYRFDGTRWTPRRPTEESLWSLAADSKRRLLAVGDHGTVIERTDARWQSEETPTDETLRGVCLGPNDAVAVGDDGVVLERRARSRSSE
ncbi:sialidase family protein [Haloprofundus salinisoli]|uniref:sialidase family protein n=1 Tax=Haloprofundus salinisoli TaxID=2876193 RepID=UPI001CCF660B|nr:hypothetical protein [Haloprofundus salinisoli]